MKNTPPNNSIIIDTGYWLALGNQRDAYHEQAKRLLASLNYLFMTTWPVITETSYLLRRDAGLAPQLAFFRSLDAGAAQLFQLRQSHCSRVQKLMKKYADLPMDLADASLVILAEDIGHGRILSTDQRDFHAYRWKNHQPFENLLLPES